MATPGLVYIYFVYGLAFFSMGLVVSVEYSRASDRRLRHALRPLAAFGLIHAANEWLEMFAGLGVLPGQEAEPYIWAGLQVALLAFSFLSLAAFGSSLLASDERMMRLSLAVPLILATIWGFGALILGSKVPSVAETWAVIDVWTRYMIGVPAALLAAYGLVVQHRDFRKAGLTRFSRDTLWAAVAFAWYGLVGQVFVHKSALPPSTVINDELFLEIFTFRVQVFRAGMAVLAAVFVTRFLRSFEYEVQHRISALQEARLQEAEQREVLRGELLKRVVSAQESERQRIARELHDETGQALTAIGLGLHGARSNILTNPKNAERNLGHLEKLTARSLQELQRLIADLRPSHLDELGLPAALRWYAGELNSRKIDLEVRVEVIGQPRSISSPAKTALFRVTQEALNNAIKHANAECADVRLIFNEASVTLEVEDDGQGFDVDRAAQANRTAWGLLGMRERAALLGGSYYLDSHPGSGTLVRVTLPYQEGGDGNHDDSTAAGG